MAKTGQGAQRRFALAPPPITLPVLDVGGRMQRDWYEFFTVVSQRLGITTDRVAAAETVVQQAATEAAAVTSGAAATPYTLTPAQPISTLITTNVEFTAVVQAHTRTEGGVPTAQPAGQVANLFRGVSYTIYYDVLGVYLASDQAVDFTVAGRRLVGAVYVAPAETPYNPGSYGEFYFP